MKFEEALKLLREGKKITRPDWEAEEYVELKNGYLCYENGEQCKEIDFNIEDFEEYIEFSLEGEEIDTLYYAVNMIKGFKGSVRYIAKTSSYRDTEMEYINIYYTIKGVQSFINTPYFKEGTMFNKMKLNKRYTLKELELD